MRSNTDRLGVVCKEDNTFSIWSVFNATPHLVTNDTYRRTIGLLLTSPKDTNTHTHTHTRTSTCHNNTHRRTIGLLLTSPKDVRVVKQQRKTMWQGQEEVCHQKTNWYETSAVLLWTRRQFQTTIQHCQALNINFNANKFQCQE